MTDGTEQDSLQYYIGFPLLQYFYHFISVKHHILLYCPLSPPQKAEYACLPQTLPLSYWSHPPPRWRCGGERVGGVGEGVESAGGRHTPPSAEEEGVGIINFYI